MPLLQLSQQAVMFTYIHADGQQTGALTESVLIRLVTCNTKAVVCCYRPTTVHCIVCSCANTNTQVPPLHVHVCNACRNVSKLPLSFTLKATTPFSITPSALSLQSQEHATVQVSFDVHYRGDQISHTAKQRCLISYPDNPQRDWLDLTGVIEFPNLVFDTTSIDFGCVLMDSMKRMVAHVTNPGTRAVRYNWSWLKQATSGRQGAGESPCTLTALPHTHRFFHLIWSAWCL